MRSLLDIQILNSVGEFRSWRAETVAFSEKAPSPPIGFVPTMGALHRGHRELIDRSVRDCRITVVSIFVNPLQFGPGEDYARYPRTFDLDVKLCREAGVQAVFSPRAEEFYPAGLETTRVVPPAELTGRLCGIFRPGHFEGVTTVVMKLFGTVEPDRAYFGQKDYQQLAIIKRMVADLNLPVEIVPVETVREGDGLALSSRNAYLSPEDRARAPSLHKALCNVRDQALSGVPLTEAIDQEKQRLHAGHFNVQYLDVCDPATLAPQQHFARPAVILVAALLGGVRLIDNILVP